MKTLSQNKIFIACLIIFASIFYFAGKYLQSVYGLDPPYIYFWTGFLLETAAFVFFIVFLLTLLLQAFANYHGGRIKLLYFEVWQKLKKNFKA